jgi:hypothetical protein
LGRNRNSRLKDRLENYTAAARSSGATRTMLGKRLGNWPVYAAATGSAMAMATNASAGAIYSGFQNLTASVTSVGLPGPASVSRHSSKAALLTSKGAGFSILVEQAVTKSQMGVTSMGMPYLQKGILAGGAGVLGFGGLEFLDQGSYSLRKLRFGKNISTQFGFGATGGALKEFAGNSTLGNLFSVGVWRPGQERFAAFAIYNYSTANPQYELGWVRLVYSASAINGAPDSITAVDWAFDPSGAPVTTGEGIPEPSTLALALLASGAVGVAALRRRRKVSA